MIQIQTVIITVMEVVINNPSVIDTITSKINTKTTLIENGRYYICGNIEVDNDLIIKPGVEIIMCSATRLKTTANGSINAIGSASNPIIIKGEQNMPGYWDLIDFNSNNPNNILKHVIISDGGYSNNYYNATVWINDNYNGQLSISHTTIKNSKGPGLYMENGARFEGFSNNTFEKNNVPVVIPFANIGQLDEASNYGTTNTNNYIKVYNAALNGDATVAATNVPYYIEGRSEIKTGLKLNPGVKFLMGSDARMSTTANGYFNAIGTADKPIIITGKEEVPGYWEFININSNNPNNKMEYVELSYGGSSSNYKHSSIWVNDNNNGQLTVNNCTFKKSYSWAIYVEQATIYPSDYAAINASNTFIDNGAGANANCTDNCSVYFQ
ncbi:MAG TPA: hypothetical protein VK027_09480 [Chitinophagaceae bacterium]|nr:hypothetical protein [Chitinophagaceae bacterium]